MRFVDVLKAFLKHIDELKKQNVRLYGEVTLRHIRNGKIIREITIPNVITDVGKAQVAGLIGGLVTTPFKYIAIGDGDESNPGSCASESSSDTALGHELQRLEATVSQVTTSVSNDTLQLEATFSFSANASICESGVFDASTGGNMLARKTFSVMNFADGDSLQVTWKIQVQ